jgi:hypothetical protein
VTFLRPLLATIAAAGLAWLVWLEFGFARRATAPAVLCIVAAADGICGLATAVLGIGHLTAVIARAVSRGSNYNFRLYSVGLIGVLLSGLGLFCLVQAKELLKRSRLAWNAALWASTLLVIVTAPLIPIQSFAIPLTIVATINLVFLIASRREFVK